jgi:hypothetical protein
MKKRLVILVPLAAVLALLALRDVPLPISVTSVETDGTNTKLISSAHPVVVSIQPYARIGFLVIAAAIFWSAFSSKRKPKSPLR